jgi:hypothetical protein
MAAGASVILHVPARYDAMLAKAERPLLFGAIRDLIAARGGRVVLAPLAIPRDATGRAVLDGDLHIVNNGQEVAEGYLNAATAYLEGYWHLDPRGVQAASSIGLQPFDPALVDPVAAAVHLAGLQARFLAVRQSRYRQPPPRADLPAGCIAVFLQGPQPYRRGQAFMDAAAMLRAVCAGAGGREVWVKPHPLKQAEGEALIARLRATGLAIRGVTAHVHDLAAVAAVTVSVNSAVAIEGMLQGTPAILFGTSDFHTAVETVRVADEFADALARALARPRDYAAFLMWYFGQCLWLGDPALPERILQVFDAAGFRAARLGLSAAPS